MTPARRENLERLLKPRHIAFIGGRDATIAVREARRRGFHGQMWAVNPKRADLDGVTCVPRIANLPEPPDAVYLAIPAAGVTDALRELEQMGAGGVVCFSAGFKETGDTQSERDLIEAAGDLALIGPNCYGMINYIDNAALWSFEHGGWSPGYGAAIVTQSGMFSSDITMSARSLPMAYMVSAGNQAVLGIEEFLDTFAEDPAVRAIGLHIEGLRDIAAFERAALKALDQGVPVVALKTGSSSIGATLTFSHTGSLSGSNELYQALFDRIGVISVTSPSQFLESLKYFCVAGPPKGARIAGFTCSGGGATMLADHAEKIGLNFPTIGPDGQNTLTSLLPDIATVSNPLDYTTPIWGHGEKTYPVFATAISALHADLAVLVQDYPAEGLDASKIYYQNDAAAFAQAAQEHSVPAAICSTLPENLDRGTRRHLIELGVAPMQGIHETLNAMRDAIWWSETRARTRVDRLAALRPGATIPNPMVLTEDKGKSWLRQMAVAVPNGHVCNAAEAAGVAQDIGYPVALKMMSPSLPHKTEAGAVALGIKDAEGLSSAIKAMTATVAAYDRAAVTDRFLIEVMSPKPLAELIVTLRADPQFGPSLVIGSGGVLTELVRDARTVLLPASKDEIERALCSLRVARLLEGYRGSRQADIPRIADALHRLCTEFLKARGEVAEIEINPMFVYPDHIVAVDALIQVPRS
ncbi:acetyl coenzyme A synthetase (ADP forming), alpha domain [Ruegeria denitrificans]|uniref:Acetyl coenzyme A synthetase (ADP forming), alpha domain n=1 Tax=Ruegeria denitrificans TaxID=1715692 RepID=A0A0P1ILC9_9RHOB|nr:acetate--CoA ligase family protein [Ruegeria denitrificans]CUJ82845.1 acetyl coenzyme A synthetase (ADP forming), alpha domain [Ruegeria denitrificans]